MTPPSFWRDETLPFIEARSIRDGRKVCYAKHSHETFSIGAITGGNSIYLNGRTCERVGAGAVVVINPEEVHACNPIDDQPWSYHMLYVDVPWLTELQHEMGFSRNEDFKPFSTKLSGDPGLHAGLNRLCAILYEGDAEIMRKQEAAIAFFSGLQDLLNPGPAGSEAISRKLVRAAEYISENCTRSLKLDEICAAAELSSAYLIRSFKKHFGLTPHAYQINRRIQFCRGRLRQGHRIADVALEAGFADQAHLQREFKRLVAATPGQYRG